MTYLSKGHFNASLGDDIIYWSLKVRPRTIKLTFNDEPPNFSQDSNASLKVKTTEEGVGIRFLARNTLKVKGHVVRRLLVPLLPVQWGDYTWKYICYKWRKNASVFLNDKSCS
jgi:hypothetical protein